MDSILLGALSALWLGILTSISPCPLATNVAAISFVGKHVKNRRKMILSGLLYTCGRMIAYILVSVIIIAGLLSVSRLSFFLQDYMNILLGPILLLTGIVLLGLFPFSFPDLLPEKTVGALAEKGGLLGVGVLGFVFALSFCPTSAALFFGSLIPISVKHHSSFLFPSLYGIGTGLPVFVFAVIISISVQSVGKAFNKISQFEKWARKVTGVIFILIGLYYSLIYIFT